MHYGLRKRVFSRFRKKRSFFRPQKHRLKNHQNFHFFKGVNPPFLSKKWRFFNPYFLCKIDQETVFFEDCERKETFLEQKNIGS